MPHHTERLDSLRVRGPVILGRTQLNASGADLNALVGLADVSASAVKRVVTVPFAGGTDTGGGLFSWVNPEAGAIVVNRVTLDVTAAATAACTAKVGTTTSTATTVSNNLIDSEDVHTAAGTFDNFANPGSSGKFLQKLAAGGWVTGSTGSGASAGLAGNAYIEYFLV